MATYKCGRDYHDYDKDYCKKDDYYKGKKCLKELKCHAHALYKSPCDKYFDKTVCNLGYALNSYEDALKCRKYDYALLKEIDKNIRCCEKYDMCNFNCPRCKAMKCKAADQIEQMAELQDKGFYYAEKAFDNLQKSNKMDKYIKYLGCKYKDCVLDKHCYYKDDYDCGKDYDKKPYYKDDCDYKKDYDRKPHYKDDCDYKKDYHKSPYDKDDCDYKKDYDRKPYYKDDFDCDNDFEW